MKGRAAQNKTSGPRAVRSCFKEPGPGSRAGPCRSPPSPEPPCSHLPVPGSEPPGLSGGRGGGLPCLRLFLPLHPPPKRRFPCIVRAVCLEKLLTAARSAGSVRPWLRWAPLQPRATSPRPPPLAALATSCLVCGGGMTQQETFPKQRRVESLTACGFGPRSPGWGPPLCSANKTGSCSCWFARRHNGWHRLRHVLRKLSTLGYLQGRQGSPPTPDREGLSSFAPPGPLLGSEAVTRSVPFPALSETVPA